MEIKARFARHVEKLANGCWVWTGATDKDGYGVFQLHRTKSCRASRFAWEQEHGPIPEGQLVLHNCPTGDNPACVRPTHLYLGTQADNIADRQRKGRTARGETHVNAVLTDATVLKMRREFVFTKKVYAELGREYGISATTAANIIHGKIWKHLEGAHPQPLKGMKAMKGSAHGMAKLTEESVKEIKACLARRKPTQRELAERHGVSLATIEAIASGRLWKHVG